MPIRVFSPTNLLPVWDSGRVEYLALKYYAGKILNKFYLIAQPFKTIERRKVTGFLLAFTRIHLYWLLIK